MDGCHWFNCDVGLFGTRFGLTALQKYLELMEEINDANVMIEKFHLTEAVYQQLYNQKDFDFSNLEKRLAKLKTKIIMVTFNEDEEFLQKRLQDRLNLYPHYARIAQTPKDYIAQQRMYLALLKKSKLDNLVINASGLPDEKLTQKILEFLGEK